MSEGKSFNVPTKREQDGKEKLKERMESLGETVEEKMKKLYPTLHIEAKTIQESNEQNNIPESYLFDIWMEPLILEQKPTTIVVLDLSEESLQGQVEKTLQNWKDHLAKEAMEQLGKKYPGIRIRFNVSKKFPNGAVHFFSVSCPEIIPSDGIEDNPSDSLAIETLSKEVLLSEVERVLNDWQGREG